MKSILGGFLMIAVVGWLLWSLSAKGDCEQVHRLGTPVNLLSHGLRELSENWIEDKDRLEALVWSIEAKEFVEKFVARTFYSKTLTCGWSS